MINFDFDKNCYGCRNCENICPVKAIRIIENKEGFFIPEVDRNKCIDCGMCDKMCPYLNYQEYGNLKEKSWYGAYNKQKDEREKSTSGAIFPALAKYFLDKKGIVVGCVWDEEMKPIHIIARNNETIEKMKGSKYVQSDLMRIAKKIKEEIKNKIVLFTGTPCQVAAIKSFCGESKNLYTCSLICEGVPSNKIWQYYKQTLEEKCKSKMIYASFRNKEISWESPIAIYKFKNGKVIKNMSYNADKYVVGFLEGLYYRKSCNNCQYKGNGHNADIIIGDLWGATQEQKTKTDNKGISLVIINSLKGEELFKILQEEIYIDFVDKKVAINNNNFLMKPISKHKNRERFFENLEKIKLSRNIKINLNRKIYKGSIKNILYKIGIFKTIKNGGKKIE